MKYSSHIHFICCTKDLRCIMQAQFSWKPNMTPFHAEIQLPSFPSPLASGSGPSLALRALSMRSSSNFKPTLYLKDILSQTTASKNLPAQGSVPPLGAVATTCPRRPGAHSRCAAAATAGCRWRARPLGLHSPRGRTARDPVAPASGKARDARSYAPPREFANM